MVRKINVRRESQPVRLVALPADFPPLLYLRLDLFENKKKLKKNLPYIAPTSTVPLPAGTVYPLLSTTGAIVTQELPLKKEQEKSPALPESPRSHRVPTLARTEDPTEAATFPEEKEMIESLREDDDTKAPESPPPESGAGGETQKECAEESVSEPTPEDDAPIEEDEDPYAGLSPEDRERKEREEYTWRFRILKKQYRNLKIPEFTEYSPVDTIKTQYNQIIRELQLDDNVDTYRTYLFGSWLAIEFVCTQWIGVDLSGFTKHQAMMLHKYNKLLIELGEKNRAGWGANLPVEVRLIGLVIFQAGIFYLIKVVSEKFGCSVSDLFGIFMGQPTLPKEDEPAGTAVPPAGDGFGGGLGAMLGNLMGSMTGTPAGAPPFSARDAPDTTKMRGPSIRAEDVRLRRNRKMPQGETPGPS